MRLFVGLDIDQSIRERIELFLVGVRGFAPEARWVKAESLHITLKFIGEKNELEASEIKRVLHEIRSAAFELTIRGCGFFPSARAPSVFWIGVQSDERLPSLASAIDRALLALEIAREEHAYTPHLTLARAKTSRLRRKEKHSNNEPGGLGDLQKKLGAWAVPEFGSMTAREFFLYQSQTGPGGSKYTKLDKFTLQ